MIKKKYFFYFNNFITNLILCYPFCLRKNTIEDKSRKYHFFNYSGYAYEIC